MSSLRASLLARPAALVAAAVLAACASTPADRTAEGLDREGARRAGAAAPPSADPATSPRPATPGRLFLYLQVGARLRAFSVDGSTGGISPVDDGTGVESARNPIYLAVDRQQQRLLAAHDGGQTSSHAIDPAQGTLTSLGSVPNDGAPVYVDVHRGGRLVVTGNYRGLTWIGSLHDDGKLEPGKTYETGRTTHSARFHPGGRFAYSLSGAEIAVAPSGRFVYASVRNPSGSRDHNVIAGFAVQPDGRLRPLEGSAGHQDTEGRFPRGFVIDPSGTFLIVANQRTGNVVVFRIDPRTGALTRAAAHPRPAAEGDVIGIAVASLPAR